MPELPEVESVLRTLRDGEPSLIGQRIRQVQILRASVVDGNRDALAATLQGCLFTEIRRHGKYLFFRFSDTGGETRWLALHLRMTGRLYMASTQAALSPYTRLVVHLEQGLALLFDDPRAFGRVWLVESPADVTDSLGPDALAVGQLQFVRLLQGLRRQLKPLLLDQAFIAGLGNIYADESLFRARLHPLQNSAGLATNVQQQLFIAVKEVMEQAVACKGANIDGVFKAGAFPVAVYGRTGKPCLVCGTAISRLRVGQRSTHFCPSCQSLLSSNL